MYPAVSLSGADDSVTLRMRAAPLSTDPYEIERLQPVYATYAPDCLPDLTGWFIDVEMEDARGGGDGVRDGNEWLPVVVHTVLATYSVVQLRGYLLIIVDSLRLRAAYHSSATLALVERGRM